MIATIGECMMSGDKLLFEALGAVVVVKGARQPHFISTGSECPSANVADIFCPNSPYFCRNILTAITTKHVAKMRRSRIVGTACAQEPPK
jgi:hypothetical protein